MVCGVERWVRAELPPPLSPQQSTSSQGRAEHKLQRQNRAGQLDNILLNLAEYNKVQSSRKKNLT